jgi:phytoene/squalene synthetase
MRTTNGTTAVIEATSEDRAYCRRVLPRVSRTFALTLRML